MTNVDKKYKSEDVQTHIKTSFLFINEHLPRNYTSLVQKKMLELGQKNVTTGAIRNIRSRALTDKAFQNLPVITALLEVAKDIHKERSGFIAAASDLVGDDK